MFKLITLLSTFISLSAMATPHDGRVDIWPTIPFVRGADLCKFSDAYGQTRRQYMDHMVRNAQDLMMMGATGYEALDLLISFNSLYERNQALAVQHRHLDVTLESTFKAYIDSYYRKIQPKQKKISFRHVNDLLTIVRSAQQSRRDNSIDERLLESLDYIAYGTYAFAPDCRGDIQVTLHLIGKDGRAESFEALGRPQYVMSQISAEVFTLFQRTSFPSEVRIGNRMLTLVGALNGSVDTVTSPRIAEEACKTLDARLPTQMEIELLDSYGDWSGGVSINGKVWAMANNRVYHPKLMNPSPVRERTSVNEKTFLYYCVR